MKGEIMHTNLLRMKQKGYSWLGIKEEYGHRFFVMRMKRVR